MAELRSLLTLALNDELDAALSRISHCLSQLSEDQVWHRSRADLNSIGNLLLHLTGNIRQLIVTGIGGSPDDRDRPAEFSARGGWSKADLLSELTNAVEMAKAAIANASDEAFARKIPVARYDWTGLQAVVRSVAHFRGHTQEIIHQTREMLGDAYHFAGPR